MNVKLEAALAYSRMRWRIFPCHSIVTIASVPACSCGKQCASPGKHPRTRGGFKDATDDEAQIRRWWGKWPDANIALATGSGLAVIDIDGMEGAHEFKALVEANEPLPQTLTAATGRGLHAVFATRPDRGEVRSSARGHVHVRGEGGYVILAPSNHISGREYKWIAKHPVAVMPDWLRQWTQGYEITANKPANALGLGPAPNYLSKPNQVDIGAKLTESLKTIWSPSEQARIISALAAIPADNYQTWIDVGMALHQLGWEGNGTDLGLTIWDQWSQLCPDKYSAAAVEAKWNSFGRTARGEITLGTVYHLAQKHGWNPAPAPAAGPAGSMNGHGGTNGANGHAALPAAFLTAQEGAIVWADTTEKGLPRPTMTNTKIAINALGVECRYDLFHNRMLVAGELISKWNSAELSDHITSMLRDHIRYRYGFDPGKQSTQDAAEILCLARRFDPVLDYLDGLQWDGKLRLARWMVDYLGAADTELNRSIGMLSLIAAVRRARRPGTKFDQIIILEGPQGQGKSEAIEILAGPDNFSDQSILGVDDRKQQELTEGVWLYEIGELSGMRRAEIEHVKAFASRKVDRARPAYGRYTISQPRRTVFFASTNQDNYLQDDSGNRRFWPVKVSRIDLAALRRDRDQLWAEAVKMEAEGTSHFLPERLWHAAAEEQEHRMESDEWMSAIHNYLNLSEKAKADVSITDVLADNQFLRLEAGRITRREQMRAGAILRRLGYTKYRKRLSGNAFEYRYRRD